MKRIGVAASKMAKDNLVLYNLYVILLSFLFSLFIFIIAGATVLFTFFITSYLASRLDVLEFEKNKETIFVLCMVLLTSITIIFNILAILKNIQLSQHRE